MILCAGGLASYVAVLLLLGVRVTHFKAS
jgi:hypothetical protein